MAKKSAPRSDYLLWKYRRFDESTPLLHEFATLKNDDPGCDGEYVEIIARGTLRGAPRAADWPDVSAAVLRKPAKKGLSDQLDGSGYLVVSDKLADSVREASGKDVELLPLHLVFNKKPVAGKQVWLVNPLAMVDCLDAKASDVSTIDGTIFGCKQMILKADKIPRGLSMFRLKKWPLMLLVRRALAETLTASGASGLTFLEPEQYSC